MDSSECLMYQSRSQGEDPIEYKSYPFGQITIQFQLISKQGKFAEMSTKSQQNRSLFKNTFSSKRAYTIESQPPALEHSLSKHSDKILTNHVQLPFQPDIQQNASIFRPPTDFRLSRRTNVKYLNEFLKKQIFVIKHKDKWVIKNEGKGSESQKMHELQEKIIRMIRLQNQSQLIPSNQALKQHCASVINMSTDLDQLNGCEEDTRRKTLEKRKVLSLNSRAESPKKRQDLPKISHSTKKYAVAAELIRIGKRKSLQSENQEKKNKISEKTRKITQKAAQTVGKTKIAHIDIELQIPSTRKVRRGAK